LDNYTVHHHIGEGAFGEVSLAVENATKQTVAIKAVSIRKILELNKERHILREKELLKDLKHPNII
jgi:serine/threonine protein kinase